jgi:hypothetical protein
MIATDHQSTKSNWENKAMNIYSINLIFTTDRPITEIELDTLRSQVIAQIEEPVDSEGIDVDYTTSLIGGNK